MALREPDGLLLTLVGPADLLAGATCPFQSRSEEVACRDELAILLTQ
jgi:hypothetical protein